SCRPISSKLRGVERDELGNRKLVIHSGSAREKLHDVLQHAHWRYHTGNGSQRLGGVKHLVTELRQNENACRRLMTLLASKTKAVQSTFGLRGSAAEEADRLTDSLRQVLARDDYMKLREPSRALFSGRGRLETAIEGVEALHRWAKVATERNEQRTGKLRPNNGGVGNVRHKGNVGLNQYIAVVVEDGWCGVWGHPLSDGRPLWTFVMTAAAGIGEPMSEDASRERIRRIF